MVWAPDYVELQDAKDYMRIIHNNDDAFVAQAISAVSRKVDGFTHRQFGNLTTPQSLRFQAWYDTDDQRWVCNVEDLYSTTGLVVTVGGTVVTEYDLAPEKAALYSKPWERIIFRTTAERQPTGEPLEVNVFGLYGWAAFPAEVPQATYIQVHRICDRRSASFGIAGSPDGGGEIMLLERLDVDVALMLKDVRRKWYAR